MAAPVLLPTAPNPDRGWTSFKARYVLPDGRVADTGNGHISHSEGQSYGMLLAERHDDRAAFEAILAWTERTLRLPGNPLLAWRYDPRVSAVTDPNNATDGDLVFAWALLRGAARWRVPEWQERARLTAFAIRSQCVRRGPAGPILLPGRIGFDNGPSPVTNPSYYVFPALRALERAFPGQGWAELAVSGHRLLTAGFGPWSLPADWIELRPGGPTPWTPRPARFGFDAVRVPLNLLWVGHMDGAVAQAARFWASPRHPYRPAWTDLASGGISPYPASAGVEAVARLAIAAAAGRPGAANLPCASTATDYYAAALALKARMAQEELAVIA
ncbi:MAG: glycosyl hydrolase family 5 [Acetobacteraceae bacterium]|nr:glycosyl hydrolase family 5 [Acetobacteraceae bacterium]